MGFMSDMARNAYRKSGGSAYVPEWYKTGIWIGGLLAGGALVVSAVFNDQSAPPSTYGSVAVSTPAVDPQPTAEPEVGPTVALPGANGGTFDIEVEAYEVARLAGVAIWTGDWAEVPVDGELPQTSGTYPDAVLGEVTVLSASPGSVSLLFELDQDGSGTVDQQFQLTVVNDGDGWRFPVYGG